jgi:hypothetical protein
MLEAVAAEFWLHSFQSRFCRWESLLELSSFLLLSGPGTSCERALQQFKGKNSREVYKTKIVLVDR